jgi:hypothetical protein
MVATYEQRALRMAIEDLRSLAAGLKRQYEFDAPRLRRRSPCGEVRDRLDLLWSRIVELDAKIDEVERFAG